MDTANLTANLPQILPSILLEIFGLLQFNPYICNACSKTGVLEQTFYMKLDYIR